MDVRDLERAAELLDAKDVFVAPAGPMAKHVGPQLTQEELCAFYRYYHEDELEPRIARQIRAFPVPALVGATFRCSQNGYHAQLDALLTAALPGTRWETERMSRGGPELVEKYCLLDGWYAASPDRATGQVMLLALTGHARRPGSKWHPGGGWTDTMEFDILSATWSNVGGLGFGLGLYL